MLAEGANPAAHPVNVGITLLLQHIFVLYSLVTSLYLPNILVLSLVMVAEQPVCLGIITSILFG